MMLGHDLPVVQKDLETALLHLSLILRFMLDFQLGAEVIEDTDQVQKSSCPNLHTILGSMMKVSGGSGPSALNPCSLT